MLDTNTKTMELIIFDTKTMPLFKRASTVPRVQFGKTGVISFNKTACSKMGLKPGDRISFAQDKQYPDDWYFFKSEDGFELRSKDFEKTGMGQFNHSKMVNKYVEHFGIDAKQSHSLLLSGEPEVIDGKEFWCVLKPNNI